MKTPCAFCSDFSGLELVYEDDVAAVAIHEDWAVLGHVMVIAKQHVENLSELLDADRFMRVYRRAERVLLQLTGAERAIILKLGIVTPHLHLHIYPVSASLDRKAVLDIIDGRVRVEVDQEFVERVGKALDTAASDE